MSPEEPPDTPAPPDGPNAPDGSAAPHPHDETGLDLARSIARSLARPGARRRTSSPRFERTDPRATGAHPDERDPQLLDATIGRLIGEQGWGTDVRVHAVFSRWHVLVGREVAQHCLPESFAPVDGGGRLVVRTDSTAWATQMKLLAPTVVRRLNEELGDGTVTVIEVLGPHGPSWKRGLRSVRDGRGPRDTYG